jgi:hypothetical protein
MTQHIIFAGRLRFGDAFLLALEYQFAFKWSDPAQARQPELAGGRLGVQAQVENPHGDALTSQRLKNAHQIRDRAGKPLQLGNDENVCTNAAIADDDGLTGLSVPMFQKPQVREKLVGVGGREGPVPA